MLGAGQGCGEMKLWQGRVSLPKLQPEDKDGALVIALLGLGEEQQDELCMVV